MARIKFSGLIDSINGTIGGTVFQRNRYGYTVKAKPVKIIPRSIPQQSSNSLMIRCIQAWKDLTPAQRGNWITYAATYPRATRLDPDQDLNGYNYFIHYHLLRFLVVSTVNTAPNAATGTMVFESIALALSGSQFNITVDVTTGIGSKWWIVYAGSALRETQYLKPSQLRVIKTGAGAADFTTDLATNYSLIFADIPSVGDYIPVRVVYVHQATGQVFESDIQLITVT